MRTGRLEAFSDGVVAIIITIMVLELRIPEGTGWNAFRDDTVPTLLIYVLSFVYLGIYWNNHHHLFHATERVNGKILWANMHLLFWLSLTPFGTKWIGEHFESLPTSGYGIILFMAAVAWTILQRAILSEHGPESTLAAALGRDLKGKLSLAFYAAGVAIAFVQPMVAIALYVIVALMWLVPDRRIESEMGSA